MDEFVVEAFAGEASMTRPERNVVLEELADVSGSGESKSEELADVSGSGESKVEELADVSGSGSMDGDGEGSSLEANVLPDLVDTKM